MIDEGACNPCEHVCDVRWSETRCYGTRGDRCVRLPLGLQQDLGEVMVVAVDHTTPIAMRNDTRSD